MDGLSDITWNNNVFWKQKLAPVYENLMPFFLEGHAANEVAFGYIVESKRLGMVTLLLSSLGISKALKAETVAEETRISLYLLSAGNSGQ